MPLYLQQQLLSRRGFLCLLGGGVAAAQHLGGARPEILQRVLSVPIADAEGRLALRYRAFSGFLRVDLGAGESIELACIPGGQGNIGDSVRVWPESEFQTTPVRTIEFPPFLLGVFEVTRGQWRRAAALPRISRNLSLFFAGPNDPESGRWPVEDAVTIPQVEEFCARLRAYTGLPFRLPSEAEWEYACRAGTTSRYHFGESFGSSVMTSEFLSFQRFQPVGSLNAPNRFGLFDMHGSVSERCEDWEHRSYVGAPADGRAWTSGGRASFRMIRGEFGPSGGGSARRDNFPAEGFYTGMGVRVAVSFDHGIMDPKLKALLSAASFQEETVSPYKVLSLFGEHIGPDRPIVGELRNGRVSNELGGVQVYFDEHPAPILFASRSQINVVVPRGMSGRTSALVVVKNGFQSASYLQVQIAAASPGLFTIHGGGANLAAAINQNGSVNSEEEPAQPNEVLALYGTGLGQRLGEFEDGEIAAGAAGLIADVMVTVGGITARVEYAGNAPGLVVGVDQVNIRIPAGLARGKHEVRLRAGDAVSQAGVFVVVG